MEQLRRRALRLEYITIAWNVAEGIICVIVGLLTGSVSLFAYGLESSVEIFASSLVVWDLRGANKKRESLALKLIGTAYIVVSAYVFFDAAQSLIGKHHAERTFQGIIILLITALGMGTLGFLKRDVGRKLSSPTVIADAKFTLIDGSLAATVLLGLLLNTLFGFWWADQAMALFISGVAFREGIKEFF
ncbi:MAG TPA: cation transporter [Patescibacteria group bacterium]|nr:cation transporter [Patescibacteria group bacterium]